MSRAHDYDHDVPVQGRQGDTLNLQVERKCGYEGRGYGYEAGHVIQ